MALDCAPGCAPNAGTVQEIIASPCITCEGDAGGGGGADVEQLILCDVDANGEVIGTALAVYEYDASGNPVGAPTFVNPVTGDPYVPQGVLQPCPQATTCPQPMQFCFTSTASGPVDHPGRMYDIELPINPGFAVQSLQIDDVNHPANITWSVLDADGAQFTAQLESFISARFPGATVTVTNPNIGTPVCGIAAPHLIHIECIRVDEPAPNLVELVYNGGRDLVVNPAYLTTPPTDLSQFQFYYLRRQDAGGTLNCTSVANTGWETNDLGDANRDFELWGNGPNGLQTIEDATPTPRGTPIQEITADINDTGTGPTIWQTFVVPAAGNFRAVLVHGARDNGETHRITLSTGDVDDNQVGDIINNVTNPAVVTNSTNNGGSGTPGPWTTFDQTVPLAAGTYTFAISTTNPVGNNRGGLFTDMRVYIDSPDQREAAVTDDDTCVITTEETTTTTDCQYWAPSCVNGDIVSWKNIETGAVLSNAAFWGQAPAPSCCLPESTSGGGGSVGAGNLIHNYEICGMVGGVNQTLQRVVVTDQSGGVIGQTIIGPDGGPVTPAAGWTIGACPAQGGEPYETAPVAICFEVGPDIVPWYTYERVTFASNGAEVRTRHWYNPETGVDQTVVPPGTQAVCTTTQVVESEEPGCANGVPWSRRRTGFFNEHGVLLGFVYNFVDSGGTEQPIMPAGFTLGDCPGSNRDTIVLCDPANGDQPVFVTITHNADGTTDFEYLLVGGTPFAGDPNTLIVCSGSTDPLQEVDQSDTSPVTACFATGTVPNITIERWFTYERVRWNNITQVEVSRVRHWYNPITGADVTAQPAGTPVDCEGAEVQVVESEELGCANGVPWSRRRTGFFTLDGQVIATVYNFVDSAGNEQPTAPVGFTLGDCPDTTIADVYQTTTQDVTGAPFTLLPAGTLISWTLRNRDATTATVQVNAGAVLMLDIGETMSSGSVEEQGGILNDTVTIDPGDGTVRLTFVRRT